jgi:hypothetical protein
VRKLAQKCSTFYCYFVLTPQHNIKTFFFYIRGESVFCAVQFTVPVLLGFTVLKTFRCARKKIGKLATDEHP